MLRSFLSPFVGLLMVVVACTDDVSETQKPDVDCSTPATVRDLTGLDGCGFVFELEDGTRLLPIVVFMCGTPPVPKDLPPNPLADFEYVDGKKVMINYTKATGYAGACMAGEYAYISCIQETLQTQTDL